MGFGYWVINYCEEFFKLYLFLFCIVRIERDNKKAALTFMAGLITVCCVFMADQSNIILLKGTIGLLIIIENIVSMKRKTYCYMAILGEVLIMSADMIIGAVVCDLASFDMVWENTNFFANIAINSISLGGLLACSFWLFKKKIICDWGYRSKEVIKYIVFVTGGLFVFCIYEVPILEADLLQRKTQIQGVHFIEDTVITVLFVIIAVMFLINTVYRRRFQSENVEYRTLLKRQKYYYEDLLEREEKTRKFRHDVLGHLNYMKVCLDDGKGEEARRYLEQVTGIVSGMKRTVNTGNSILDITAEYTLREADEVTLEWRGIFPDIIKMEDIDLCILFSNLLSNAIRAANDSPGEKTVKAECRVLGKNLLLQIKNPVKKGEKIKFKNGRPITTRNKEYHGLGILNIEAIVSKYNRNICFQCMDEFIVYIVLEDIIK